jgi:hypothetical protein
MLSFFEPEKRKKIQNKSLNKRRRKKEEKTYMFVEEKRMG